MLKFFHNFGTTDISKNVSCPVCFDFYTSLEQFNINFITFQCGHIICTNCYREYDDEKCHICRKIITFYTYINLKNFSCSHMKYYFKPETDIFSFCCGHLICFKCLQKSQKNYFFQTSKCPICLNFNRIYF